MESTPTPVTSSDISKPDDNNYKYIDNICVYTDPNTNKEYTWNKEKNTWIEKGFENYEFDEILKTYKYIDKHSSKYFYYKFLIFIIVSN